jgi:PAS domain S-box-containing protein
MVSALQDKGAYLTSPSWLNNWREHIREWGFKEEGIREFLQESAKEIILLDTGVINGVEKDLADFALHAGLPGARSIIGLDYCGLLFKEIIRDHLNTGQDSQRLSEAVNKAVREKADHAMAIDLLGDMTRIVSESELTDKVLELFTMLFAPANLAYWPFSNGAPGAPRSSCGDEASFYRAEELIEKLGDREVITDSKDGFIIRIVHMNETMAIIELNSIAFPEYMEHYLNLALSISRVIGLSIENARKYEKIKAVQEELRQNEERYRQIFERHPAAKLLLDPVNGDIVDANLAAATFYGYPAQQLKGMSVSILDTIHAGRLQRQILKGKDSGRGHFTYRHRLSSGEIRDVEVISGPVTIQERELFYAIIHDITERKRIETALKESEQAFRLSFEGARDAILWAEASSGVIIRCNPAAEQLFDRSRHLILGHSLAELTQIDENVIINGVSETMSDFQTHDNEFTKTIATPNIGKYLHISMSRTNVGGRAILQCIARDITALKESEISLSQALELNEKILSSSSAGIAAYDSEGRVVFTNRAMRKILGFDEIAVRNINFWNDQPWKGSGLLSIAEDVLGKGMVAQCEISLRSSKNRELWLDCRLSSFHVNSQPHLLLLANDVTDRKTLDKKRENLVEEMKNFTYIVSHDLKSPVVNLKGFTKELKLALETLSPVIRDAAGNMTRKESKKVMEALDESIPESMQFIDSSINRIDRMAGAILSLSRLGRRTLRPEKLNMDKLTREVVNSLAHEMAANRVTMEIGPLPEVVADRVSMEQIMGNLINNAIKYSRPDTDNKVEITGESLQKESLFTIRDQGTGINPKEVERIFEPFQRGGNQKTEGEGMGLAHVRTLVRRHNGEIHCESEYGKGSIFFFTIGHAVEEGQNPLPFERNR